MRRINLSGTRRTMRNIFLIIGLFVFLSSQSVHAYLDPGAGSYVFQVILAFIIGGLYTLKLYWKRIKTFLSRLSVKKR